MVMELARGSSSERLKLHGQLFPPTEQHGESVERVDLEIGK